MKTLIRSAAALIVGISTFAHAAQANPAIETAASYAYLVDDTTGQVLLAKNADQKMHPSSMSKLMTVYILFSRLKDGSVKLTDNFRVSEKAWRTQGSKTFVHVGDEIPVEALIQGIIIQSGNDACVVVAEGLKGSEEAFAQEMNKTAEKMGMTGSHFVNATGWPDENHLVTAQDLAILSSRLVKDFPEYYHYFSEKEYTFNNIKQANRNRLLGNDIGVDGLKTGHTEEAGYGITLSAKQPGTDRRLILVINGLSSDNARVEEGDKLLRWGFREFTNVSVVKAGDAVANATVWFGATPEVPLTSASDVALTLPTGAIAETKFAVRYHGPIPAPIEKGQHVADLIVAAPGLPERTIPLVAAEAVDKASGLSRMWMTLQYLLLNHVQ